MQRLKILLAGALVVCSAGCAGYHLGPVNPDVGAAGEKTIEVVPFNNQTLQPRLGDAVTQALRERLQTDGTYRLATDGPGDVVITGVITDYQRAAVGFLQSDVATADSYRITIVAHVTATANGKVIFDNKKVIGYTLVQIGTDMPDAERQSLPLLAEDLARNVTGLLTEGSW